jgi:hypothetical protein
MNKNEWLNLVCYNGIFYVVKQDNTVFYSLDNVNWYKKTKQIDELIDQINKFSKQIKKLKKRLKK